MKYTIFIMYDDLKRCFQMKKLDRTSKIPTEKVYSIYYNELRDKYIMHIMSQQSQRVDSYFITSRK